MKPPHPIAMQPFGLHGVPDPFRGGRLAFAPPDYRQRRRLLRAAKAGKPFAVALLWKRYRVRVVQGGAMSQVPEWATNEAKKILLKRWAASAGVGYVGRTDIPERWLTWREAMEAFVPPVADALATAKADGAREALEGAASLVDGETCVGTCGCYSCAMLNHIASDIRAHAADMPEPPEPR